MDLCCMIDFSTHPPRLLPVVGLTGGIGSGKTTVAGIFEALGIPVYNADRQAKLLYHRDADLRSWVVNRFGSQCGTFEQENLVGINRQALAEVVFSDADALTELNAVVHPVVDRNFHEWHALQSKHSIAPFVIREAAILIETGGHEQCDSVVVVCAPHAVRLARASRRLNADTAHIAKRMKQQLSDEARAEHADFILDNANDSTLLHQVRQLYDRLTLVRTG
ncbi:MAG: dephospho-CoA kinase [Flavobacteriales bacterium]|nr:dephospho-CoA kinase [Flavobacteriales bacterium]